MRTRLGRASHRARTGLWRSDPDRSRGWLRHRLGAGHAARPQARGARSRPGAGVGRGADRADPAPHDLRRAAEDAPQPARDVRAWPARRMEDGCRGAGVLVAGQASNGTGAVRSRLAAGRRRERRRLRPAPVRP